MVATKTLIANLAVVLTVLLCSFDSTTAVESCKRKVMKVVMMRCAGGSVRFPRDLAGAQLKNGPVSGAEEIRSELHRQPVKRQIMESMTQAVGMVGPVLTALTDASKSRSDRVDFEEMLKRATGLLSAIPMLKSDNPQENPTDAQLFGGLPFKLPSPRQVMTSASTVAKEMPTLHEVLVEKRTVNQVSDLEDIRQAFGDDLGFDLTSEEVDEFYEVISNRISRNTGTSREDIKKQIMQAAAKCCQNESEDCEVGDMVDCI